MHQHLTHVHKQHPDTLWETPQTPSPHLQSTWETNRHHQTPKDSIKRHLDLPCQLMPLKLSIQMCSNSNSRVSQTSHQLWPKIQRGIGRVVQLLRDGFKHRSLVCNIDCKYVSNAIGYIYLWWPSHSDCNILSQIPPGVRRSRLFWTGSVM